MILGGFRHGSLSVYDGLLSRNFQKVVQVLFQLEKSFGCGYVKTGLISDFFDVNREFDLVELVDEVVNFASTCGLRGFRCAGVDQVAVKAS
jgi:hypothetical protein